MMIESGDRHARVVKKEKELERLCEEAAARRRRWLKEREFEMAKSQGELRIMDNNENKLGITPRHICRNLQRSSAYFSHQHLPETNIDSESLSLHKSKPCSNNNNCSHDDTTKSSEILNKSGHHNPSFVTYSSSSDEVEICNYCHFIPATSSSTNNTTSSSHYSKTDNSCSKMSSFEPSSSDVCTHSIIDIDSNTHSIRDTENNYQKQSSSMMFYPSGSPLISPKYQGSPVVRIDNKLRAGEADYLINRQKPALGKPPIMPRRQKLLSKPLTCLATSETRLSHPLLNENNEFNKCPSSLFTTENPNNIPTTIIRRTKKKLLEEHMRKRFSVGDYSTRALIEWENNLTCAAIEHLSMSGDLPTSIESEEFTRRKVSSQSDAFLTISHNLEKISTTHNFSSEINILHCNSTDSFRDTQVSFSLKNDKQSDSKSQSENDDKFSKRTNFIQRSMNDIATAFRNVTSSEKVPTFKRFHFLNRSRFHGIFKKRDSNASDLLYSVPPFARQHLPPDISGAAKILSQGTYKNNNLPSSTPNLIAELDPTFHERYPLEPIVPDVTNQRHPLTKRNRSYRLSFIENAHTVTTKKLTAASVTTSPSNAAVLRFVQPRRRMASNNSATARRQNSPRPEPVHSRSRSSNRFSCAQQ